MSEVVGTLAAVVPLRDAVDADVFGGDARGRAAGRASGAGRCGIGRRPGDCHQGGDLTAGQAVSAPLGDLSGPLAGRSSAIGDGTSSSFAGQHLTQLNVLGAEAALAAVLAVGCSADSQSAAAYRSRMGAADARGCGVVVQARVPADVAGVMFTRNPVTGADERVIEAGWALGEAVVAGLVTPTATG